MFDHLQIYEPSERRLVGLADLATRPLRWFRRAPQQAPIRRVLLLRLERIGDLLMVLDAIADARALWPEAEIDLAVGSWNLPIANLIPNIDQIQVADVPWLARDREGDSPGALIRRARAWRQRRYDLVINFEPDVRSNLLAWLTGARQRVGYWTGGGGAFLTDASAYQPMTHVSVNARQLIARAASRALESRATAWPRLVPPRDAVARADALLAGRRRPFVGVHASGGRPSKQWHLDRFAAVARTLAETRGATIVLTGAPSDRQLVDEVRHRLPGIPIVDASVDLDLATLAALLQRLDLLITGDTGPMHLAAAMDTPVVALFGPSHPERYGPMGRRQRIIRIDLPCSPCGRVRLPPERCRGHVPDCLDGISVDMVVAAAADLLDEASAA